MPLTWDGLKACRTLRNDDVLVNVTLCFSASQALLAAKAGATFISPFVGRITDWYMKHNQLIEYPLVTQDPGVNSVKNIFLPKMTVSCHSWLLATKSNICCRNVDDRQQQHQSFRTHQKSCQNLS